MKKLSSVDNIESESGLDVLLAFHGTSYTYENGYWTKFEVWRVPKSASIPHGIRYNLTLHNPYNQRLIGFDNTHGIKARKGSGKYSGRRVVYDHMHQHSRDKGTPYEFSTAEQLLTDFLDAVDEYMKKIV